MSNWPLHLLYASLMAGVLISSPVAAQGDILPDWSNPTEVKWFIVFIIFMIFIGLYGAYKKRLENQCENCKKYRAMEDTGSIRNKKRRQTWPCPLEWEAEVRCTHCGHIVWEPRDDKVEEETGSGGFRGGGDDFGGGGNGGG